MLGSASLDLLDTALTYRRLVNTNTPTMASPMTPAATPTMASGLVPVSCSEAPEGFLAVVVEAAPVSDLESDFLSDLLSFLSDFLSDFFSSFLSDLSGPSCRTCCPWSRSWSTPSSWSPALTRGDSAASLLALRAGAGTRRPTPAPAPKPTPAPPPPQPDPPPPGGGGSWVACWHTAWVGPPRGGGRSPPAGGKPHRVYQPPKVQPSRVGSAGLTSLPSAVATNLVSQSRPAIGIKGNRPRLNGPQA